MEWRTVSALTRGLFWCSFPEFPRKMNTKMILEWAQKQFATRVHTLFYSLHNIMNPLMTVNDDLYTSSPCLTRSVLVLLMTSQSIADDVTINRQLWNDHVNNGILLVRYRFIYGDIHDWSCEKIYFGHVKMTMHITLLFAFYPQRYYFCTI